MREERDAGCIADDAAIRFDDGCAAHGDRIGHLAVSPLHLATGECAFLQAEPANAWQLLQQTAADGRVLITMPHPERSFRYVQNSWRPDGAGEYSGWFRMFGNARKWVG